MDKSKNKIDIKKMLKRNSVEINSQNLGLLLKEKTVLVTGGGGSIGSELCRQIIKSKPKKLVVLDIYENNLYEIETELNQNHTNQCIETIIGSIRDEKRVEWLFEKYRPDIVFHAAAHKHVPLMENNPLEAIKNNIMGTYNLVKYSNKYNVKKFVQISTDKAVNPTSIMGATKRFCEMMVQAKKQNSKTEYVVVRFGNVLESNGSVIPLFKKQIANDLPVTITDKRATRFFMTITEAVELILQAALIGKGGEIFILDMGEPINIYSLAVALIEMSGKRPNIDIPILVTGLRPGEKLYEEILTKEEGLQITQNDKIFIAKPLDITQEEIEKKIETLNKYILNEETTKEEIMNTLSEWAGGFNE